LLKNPKKKKLHAFIHTNLSKINNKVKQKKKEFNRKEEIKNDEMAKVLNLTSGNLTTSEQ
jgi:predicted secreted Zn-dependent protease